MSAHSRGNNNNNIVFNPKTRLFRSKLN